MKKLIITLTLLIPFVTGCTDVETRVNINNDKTANVVSSLSYQGDLSDFTDSTAAKISTIFDNFIDNTYKTERSNSSNLSTLTATKSVKNVEKSDLNLASLGLKTKHSSGKFIEVKKNFLVTSYNIDAIFDYPAKEKEINNTLAQQAQVIQNKSVGIMPEYFQKYAEDIPTEKSSIETKPQNIDNTEEMQTPLNLSFEIKLPAFASYNNADKMEGFTYIWDIKKDGVTEIKLQYVKYSGLAISFTILLGILLLILLSMKILKHDSQKRIDNVNNIV